MDTQEKTIREKEVDERFEKIEGQLALQPTKDEFEAMLEGLATKKDMELFNSYAHRFTLGVEILGKSSKWIVVAVITIGGIGAGFLVIKNGLILLLAWLGFTHMK